MNAYSVRRAHANRSNRLKGSNATKTNNNNKKVARKRDQTRDGFCWCGLLLYNRIQRERLIWFSVECNVIQFHSIWSVIVWMRLWCVFIWWNHFYYFIAIASRISFDVGFFFFFSLLNDAGTIASLTLPQSARQNWNERDGDDENKERKKWATPHTQHPKKNVLNWSETYKMQWVILCTMAWLRMRRWQQQQQVMAARTVSRILI